MNSLFELISNSPDFIQVSVIVIYIIGFMLIYKFRKYVMVIGAGAIAVYVFIKKSMASDE